MTLKHIMKDFLRSEMLHFTKHERKKFIYKNIISYEKKFKTFYPRGNCALYNEHTNSYECCGWDKQNCCVYSNQKDLN